MDYRSAGVDREEGDGFVEDLKSKVKNSIRPEVLGGIGDFGGFFQAPKYLKDPVWVATTDGVGTKLMLAEEVGGEAHRSVGQDCVAMCVNDLVACRAEPIIFLDYLATGKLDRNALSGLMEGIISACDESGCSLIGGETAEMPGYYPNNRYDVAGFSVGALERGDRFNRDDVQPGDLIFGMKSSGFHSNGYSLVRKVLKDQNWKLSQNLDGEFLSVSLLRPTNLYVKPLLNLFKSVKINAASHITGGGLIDNLPRGVDEKKVALILNKKSIETPAIMKRFVEAAKLDEREAFSTWNMGIGFCVIAKASEKTKLLSLGLQEIGFVEARTSKHSDSVLLQ